MCIIECDLTCDGVYVITYYGEMIEYCYILTTESVFGLIHVLYVVFIYQFI